MFTQSLISFIFYKCMHLGLFHQQVRGERNEPWKMVGSLENIPQKVVQKGWGS